MSDQKTVMYDEAPVEFRTNIKGWVSSDGRFWGNGEDAEHMSRYHSCTHKKCECGNLMKKIYTKCPSCRAINSHDKYKSLEAVEWDGECMIVDHAGGYYRDFDELIESSVSAGDIESLSDLRLKPTSKKFTFREINLDELNDEYVTEDESFSHFHPEITKKVDELNKLLSETESKLWFEVDKRLIIPSEIEERYQKEYELENPIQ